MKKLLLLLLVVNLFACGEEENPQPTDNFDRQAMLSHWTDQIIIPAYTAFAEKTTDLQEATDVFIGVPTEVHLLNLRTAWEAAYLGWQAVAMFEIGKAEELLLTNNLNIYPVDVMALEANISTGTYNLELPSTNDQQGFPALDYLLYGVSSTPAEVVAIYATNENYRNYLQAVVNRINGLAQVVLNDWTSRYRDEFVASSGNSATASVDRFVNDYIFYYEKHLRAGKVGIPAGVFSGAPLENTVEAYYRRDFSKTLLLASLDAVQDFFNGKSFAGTNTGPSLAAYLTDLNAEKNGVPLADVINEQFNTARQQASTLADDFTEQIAMDNTAMLATYDQLQINVINLKVDMLQKLNINVDYVDADGD
ncbi:imelysin family protein [Lewinella sp. LCG006]|uniref:imelysin family protein n=1 Tax=Lewinella sp. LCG006 TaxID=3231911 RepID=UPI0034610752